VRVVGKNLASAKNELVEKEMGSKERGTRAVKSSRKKKQGEKIEKGIPALAGVGKNRAAEK